MKKLTHCLIIIILLCFGMILALSALYNSQVDQKNSVSGATTFTIDSGESVNDVANALHAANLITNPLLFDIYTKLSGTDTQIQAGTYAIPAGGSIVSIARLLKQASSDTMTITIREGLRIEEQAADIDKELSVNNQQMAFNEQDFIRLAHDPSQFSYPFITSSTTSLEGFLFPDTYNVSKAVTAQGMINIMLADFQTKMYDHFTSINNGLNFYQTLILASILEREVQTDTDQKTVAGILIKRYNESYPLQVDSTSEYELGYSSSDSTWWEPNLTAAQLADHSPYNTFTNTGFPPTPICNPGQASFNDALNPITTSYFYYLSDSSGKIHYAQTLAQQDANIQEYLQ